MPWMIYLILRSGHRPRLEGRTTPMQGPKMRACPSAKRGTQACSVRVRWAPAFRAGYERTGWT